MILQERGTTQVVYMPDIDAGHIVLGESMGLCDIQGRPALHATIEKVKYTTDCGVALDAWKMTGETVEVYALPSRIRIKGGSAKDLVDAMNSFNSPRYDFGTYVFAGKFKETSKNTLADKAGRKITTAADQMKDIPGIFNLMANLGKDGGKLFEPVIARYMWTIYHLQGRQPRFRPVGYLDLKDYLCVIRDDRRNMFSRMNSTSLIDVQLGKNPYVTVTGIDDRTGQALLAFEDAAVIDREKDKSFHPFVLIADRPFELRQEMQFRWSRVEFEKHSVFLMPVMSLQGTWRNMGNMIDLLSPRQ